MKKRIIFCDFDGTLVGRELEVSPRVRKAILQWEEEGNLFSLATGRIFAGHTVRIAQELKLTSPQISMGGAQIVDPQTMQILHTDVMPDEEVKQLIELLLEKDIYFWIEKEFMIYNKSGEVRNPTNSIIPHKKIADMEIHAIPKIGIRAEVDPEKLEFIENGLPKMFPDLHIIKAGSRIYGVVYDVTASSVSKHSAVLKVIDMLGLAREATIGIGDGHNDFPLLTVAGYGVAMGNAPEELKEIADFVTTSYDEDGVAVAIEKLLDESGK